MDGLVVSVMMVFWNFVVLDATINLVVAYSRCMSVDYIAVDNAYIGVDKAAVDNTYIAVDKAYIAVDIAAVVVGLLREHNRLVNGSCVVDGSRVVNWSCVVNWGRVVDGIFVSTIEVVGI